MKLFIKPIITLLLGLTFIGVIYFLGQKALKHDAIDKCLNAGKTQFAREGENLTGPDGFWYDFCMEEKGLK